MFSFISYVVLKVFYKTLDKLVSEYDRIYILIERVKPHPNSLYSFSD